MRVLFALMALTMSALTPAAAYAQDAARAAEMTALADAYFNDTAADMAVPGAVLVVVERGQTLVNRAWGLADVASQTPVTTDRTAFRVASLGKTFTAIAVLQQVQQGVLDLDTPVTRYVPDARNANDQVTLRRLLLHTAGYEEQVIGYQTRPGAPYPDLAAHLRARMPRQQRALVGFPSYSNYGYALAGLTVERRTGVPFRDYVRQHIFEPLGMTGAFYATPPTDDWGQLATEYTASGEVAPVAFNNPYPGGSVAVTADDMARFIAAFAAAYRGEENVIGVQTARTMTTVQAQFVPGVEGSSFAFNQRLIGGRIVWLKGGAAPKHSAVFVFIPELDVGLFIALNRQEPTFWRGLLDRLIPAFYPAPVSDAPPQSFTSDASRFEGVWQMNRTNFSSIEKLLSPLAQVRVEAADDGSFRLHALADGSLAEQAFARVGENIFRAPDHYLGFVAAPSGATMYMSIEGDHFAFHRVAWWERAELLGITAALGLLLTLTFPLTRLAAFIIAKLRRRPIGAQKSARAGHMLALAATALLGAAVFCVLQAGNLLFGPTPSLYVASAASIAFMLCTVWALVMLWRDRQSGAPLSRAHLMLACVGALLLSSELVWFNVPFFRY